MTKPHGAMRATLRRLAGPALVAAILMAAGVCGCAPQAQIIRPSPPAGLAPAAARRTMDIGVAADGKPLVVEIFGNGPKTVLILGGIHGDETRSVAVARFLADHLAANPEAVAGKTVAVLVNANPTGAANRTRTNANGVDLNRNFPASNWRPGAAGKREFFGPFPGSEPETQAILRAMELLRPDCIISLHTDGRDAMCNNFDGPAEGLARLMAAQNGYPVLANIGHPTPGSLGSWAGIDRGLPVITLELPQNRPGEECWQRNRGAILEAIAAEVPSPVRQ